MSIIANFADFYTAAQGNEQSAQRTYNDIEYEISEKPRFRQEMGADILTYTPRQLKDLMRGMPSNVSLLINRCKNAHETKTASLTKVLDAYAEKIQEGKGGQYKIGKKADGTFKLYKKGFTSDCSRIFEKTDFTGIAEDLQQHRKLTAHENAFYVGKQRQDALTKAIGYVAEKDFKSRL